jgi:hypothetical protein
MRLDDVAALPLTLTTEEAAEVYGCSPDHLWGLARAGTAPVEPLRLGRALRWPTAAVLRSVGLDPRNEDGADEAPVIPLEASRK